MAKTETIDNLRKRIDGLVAERQQMRATHASELDLERNRREIAAYQQELSHALIARYATAPSVAAA